MDRAGDGDSLARADGLSLDELKRIGGEAGLSPESVERAARSLDRPASTVPEPRRVLGIPTSVARVTPLERPLEDREWEILVAELRQTFQAQGKQETLGQTRQWTNGNLQVFVEPSEDGYRLRMGTRRGDLAAFTSMTATFIATGVFIFLIMILKGVNAEKLALPLVMMGMGAAGMGANLLRLLPWSRTREDQFEAIAERTVGMIEAAEG